MIQRSCKPALGNAITERSPVKKSKCTCYKYANSKCRKIHDNREIQKLEDLSVRDTLKNVLIDKDNERRQLKKDDAGNAKLKTNADLKNTLRTKSRKYRENAKSEKNLGQANLKIEPVSTGIANKRANVELKNKRENADLDNKTGNTDLDTQTGNVEFEDKRGTTALENKFEDPDFENKSENADLENKSENADLENNSENADSEKKSENTDLDSGDADLENTSGNTDLENKSENMDLESEDADLENNLEISFFDFTSGAEDTEIKNNAEDSELENDFSDGDFGSSAENSENNLESSKSQGSAENTRKSFEYGDFESGAEEIELENSLKNLELKDYVEDTEFEWNSEDLDIEEVDIFENESSQIITQDRYKYEESDFESFGIGESIFMEEQENKSLDESNFKIKNIEYERTPVGEKIKTTPCPCRVKNIRLTGKAPLLSQQEINDIRLKLFLKKNKDNTGSLILQGKDMDNKFRKRITDSDIYVICRFISHHPRKINVLDLRYNKITDVGFFTLLKKLLVKERSSITDLNIMNNSLTDVSLDNLRKYARFVRLKKIRINGNMFGTKGGEYFANFLLDNTSLEYADLGQSDQTFSSLAPIVGSLRKENGGNCTLKALDLSRIVPLFNRYHLNTKWLAYHIELLLLYNDTLTDVYLQRNEMLSHDMEYLHRGLKVNRTITCLDLGYNRIGDYGANLIASLLKESPLIILNLAGNGISDYGARAISFTLPFSKIRAIDVSNNQFTERGVLDILNTIKKANFSRFLNIWGNKIGHRSCVVIDRMMLSKVMCEHTIDVRVYEVDDRFYAAYCPNPIDRSKYLYFWKYGQVRDMIKTHFICTCRPRPRKMYCMPGPDAKLHYSPRNVPEKCVC